MSGPRRWREKPQHERLVAQACGDCGYVSFPEQRTICKRCGAVPDWDRVRLTERGTVQSYVIQNQLPEAFETPLPVAILDVPQEGNGEPARVFGLFTETAPEDLEIGLEAEADFRRLYEVDRLPVRSFKFTLPRGER